MRDYDLQINGADHLVAKRSGSSPEDKIFVVSTRTNKDHHQEEKNEKKKKTDRKTTLQINSPPEVPERKSVYAPNKQDRGVEGERKKKKRSVLVVMAVVREPVSSCGNRAAG